jgi:acetyl esterase
MTPAHALWRRGGGRRYFCRLPAGTGEQFPTAWDDALAAYKWVATNVGSWRSDPRRLALAGEGAGGNLALSTAISTAAAGVTRPRAVIAIYPVTQTGTTTESYVDRVNAKPLNKAMINWFLDKTLNSVADKTDRGWISFMRSCHFYHRSPS